MKIPFVDLKRGYLAVNDQVLTAISESLNSMRLFLGPNVQAFEEEFSRYCGTEFGIGVGSGTEALHLALLACGASNSDEVITVSNTFFATVEAIALTGARPVFADIDPGTYNLDPLQIESKITSKTKVILPVHLYGHPADMGPIIELARSRNLKVVEDACQAHGAEYKGRRTGSLGDVGCFSFYFTKNLGAYGEAGMIVTSDPDIARKCKMLRDHGQDIKHNHALMGVNGRLDEIQASVLRVKLPHLDEWNNKRRELAKAYDACLPSSVVKPLEMAWARHVYHLYVIRASNRDALRSWLEDNGVGTGIHYPTPIHLQEATRNNGFNQGHLPVTEMVTREILSLPMFPELSLDEVAYVCDLVRKFEETHNRRSRAVMKNEPK